MFSVPLKEIKVLYLNSVDIRKKKENTIRKESKKSRKYCEIVALELMKKCSSYKNIYKKILTK